MLDLLIESECQHKVTDLYPPTLAEDREKLGSMSFLLLLLLFSLLPLKVAELSWSGRTSSPAVASHRGHWPAEVKGSRDTSTCSCCPRLPGALCSFSGGESSTLLPKIRDREFLMMFHITLGQHFTEHIYNFFVPYKKADGFADINTKLLGTKMQLMHF